METSLEEREVYLFYASTGLAKTHIPSEELIEWLLHTDLKAETSKQIGSDGEVRVRISFKKEWETG